MSKRKILDEIDRLLALMPKLPIVVTADEVYEQMIPTLYELEPEFDGSFGELVQFAADDLIRAEMERIAAYERSKTK